MIIRTNIYLDIQVAKRKEEWWKATHAKFEAIRKGLPTYPPDSPARLSTNHMYQMVAHMCRFAIRQVISPRGMFFDAEADLGKNHRRLCEWGGSKRPYEPEPSQQQQDYVFDV